MNIIEHPNNELHIDHVAMDCDHILSEDFVPPLDSFISGFCWCIIGASGSGKTNYLCDIMQKGKRKGKQKGFRNIFNNIFIVCPTLKSIKKSPFEDLPDEFKSEELSVESLEDFEFLCKEKIEEAEEEDLEQINNLLILDDCGTTIRKSREIQNKFNQIVANRRHGLNCSIIMLLQNVTQIPPSIRTNLSHITSFYPKSLSEQEHIYNTWTGKQKKYMEQFFDFVYKKKHDTLFIDLTLRTGKYKFYRNFSLLEIEMKK